MKVENSKGQELKGRHQIVKQVFEYLVIKSSPQAVVHKNFANFTEKHLCQSLFFN